ncbi:MAG: DUF87 domain-containing protein [Peptococcaceae bacterium]|jgi:DNA phosphorothioation-dependent restriction protein DptH|nr:DUF87 domain-containing protein [Peptococcaceae bacterium]MDH7523752.1 DUF87 domain-containing protein [Peptococcaceae bacterium]
MKHLANTISDYIVESAIRRSGMYRYVLPSYPSVLLWSIGVDLEEKVNKIVEPRILLSYAVAYRLGQKWQENNNPQDLSHFQSICNKGWYNWGNNLTSFRNQIRNPEDDNLLIVMAGYEDIDDQASLSDFFRLDQTAVWEICLNKSFITWVNAALKDWINLDDSKTHLQAIGDLLASLYEYGLSDLIGISHYLESIDFSGISNGRDAYRLILENLAFFKLPCMPGLEQVAKKRDFRRFIVPALEFFNYSMFLDSKEREKIVQKLSKLKEDTNKPEPESHELGPFQSLDELLDALLDYINNRSEPAKERLYKTDFIFLYEKILGYKPKKTESKERPTKVTKLTGVPPEVFLRALWLTLKEHKNESKIKGSFIPETLESIYLHSLLFKHDFNASGENDEHEDASLFLRVTMGGINEYLKNKLRICLVNDEEAIDLKCELLPGPNNFEKTRTAEPFLRFEVVLNDSDGTRFVKEFQWVIPENHPLRLLFHLYRWAFDEYKHSRNVLPAYAIPYLPEIFMARDEEECIRLLEAALKTNDCRIIDLINTEGVVNNDVVFPSLQKLSLSYQRFLNEVWQQGFYSALENRFSNLQDELASAYKAYLEHANSSIFGPILLKTFMFVSSNYVGDDNWIWDTYLEAGIVTPLHPALLEMILHQYTYLCDSFCYYIVQALKEAGDKLFAEKHWDRLVDLATIRWPLLGILSNYDLKLNTNTANFGYIHLVGKCNETTSMLNSRLLMDYEDEDEEITDTELFRITRTSALIKQVCQDYLNLHEFARDGITVGAYCGKEIQPLITGLDSFLSGWLKNDEKQYFLHLILFSDSGDDTTVMRWLNAWKNRWQQAEFSSSMSHYKNCLLSISHRVISRSNKYEQFKRLLQETEMDLMIFTEFVDSEASNFEPIGEVSYQKNDYRKFPILEKVSCRKSGGGQDFKRERVLSNQRFRLCSLHAELMVRLKNKGIVQIKNHAVVSRSDFKPWIEIIDAAHSHSGWVVCIDPSVDEPLLLKKTGISQHNRDIIGFGTGVGPRGENNYTISTEQFSMVDIKKRISNELSTLFNPLDINIANQVADNLVQEAANIAGLSLVKATGPQRFVREFIANALARKLLKRDSNVFCDVMVSLDAFPHWFDDMEDGKRPDLLRLHARVVDRYLQVDAQLIECKLAQQNEGHLEKARQQLENGLKKLVPCFSPHKVKKPLGLEDKPDQRYWWMQLHRLIASKGETTRDRYPDTLMALEHLSEGYFDITWQASVLAIWTDFDSDTLSTAADWNFSLDGQEINIPVVVAGKYFIKKACLENAAGELLDSGTKLEYNFCRTDKDTDINDAKQKADGEMDKGSQASQPQDGENDNHQVVLSGKTVASGDKVAMAQIPKRILLGNVIGTTREVYWEFGHSDLPNRHILVFGASGTGKTYTIQALLWELAKNKQNSLIVDYTNGFTTKQLEPIIIEKLNPKQHIIRKEPLPINPFRQQSDYIDNIVLEEKPSNTADRVSGVFASVYNLGDQQKSALYNAIREGIEQYHERFDFYKLMDKLDGLRDSGGPVATSIATVINKIQPFIDMNPFGKEDVESWERLFTDPNNRCNIIQLAGFSKDTQRLITEFSLIDLYWYYRANGQQDKPRIIVLDEIQNLDHRLESPLGQFLTEGRKFGICLILATQTLSNLSKEERDRLFQASCKLFFKPADTEIKSFAGILSDATGDKNEEWVSRLSSLKRGECYFLGHYLNEKTGNLEVNKHFKVRITAIQNRL